jgi:hypothetical protein
MTRAALSTARARLQGEIAALAQEVHEFVQGQPEALPDEERLALVMVALAGEERAYQLEDGDERETAGEVAEEIRQLALPPLGEPVRAGLLTALEHAATADGRSYRSALRALQPVVDELLALRGEQWRERIGRIFGEVDLHRCALVWLSLPEDERHRYIAPQHECTDPLVMAGMLLRCAAGEMEQAVAEQPADQIRDDREQT